MHYIRKGQYAISKQRKLRVAYLHHENISILTPLNPTFI